MIAGLAQNCLQVRDVSDETPTDEYHEGGSSEAAASAGARKPMGFLDHLEDLRMTLFGGATPDETLARLYHIAMTLPGDLTDREYELLIWRVRNHEARPTWRDALRNPMAS